MHLLFSLLPMLLCAIFVFTACAGGADTAANKAPTDSTNVIVSSEQKPTPSPSPAPAATDTVAEEVKYNDYNLTLDIDPVQKTVKGLEKVTYKNRSAAAFDHLYFNLYLNAFSETVAHQPYFSAFEQKIFGGAQKDFGEIRIDNVSVNHQNVDFTVDETVLTITLAEPLAQQDSAEIALQFQAKIPEINHRTGAKGDALWFGSFIPVLAVYDDAGWHTEPYYPAGNPFFVNIANVTAQISTPAGYRAIGTGEETFTEEAGRRQTVITAKMVRDFAFTVDREQTCAPRTAQTKSGVYVNLYTTAEEEKAVSLLTSAVKSLDYYGQLVGTYPYTSLDIVETGLPSAEGMGYAQIIFMDTDFIKTGRAADMLSYQIGRQWFYSVVGSNQVKDAWLSEGIAAYLQEKLFSGTTLRENIKIEYDALQTMLKTMKHQTLLSDLSVYEDWQAYFDIEHTRAKLMLYALNESIGEENFEMFIKTYYSKYSFKIATQKDFITTAEEVTGRSLTSFFDAWLGDAALPQLVWP
ncbi:MAG: M1 family metallopeptidase [Clostridiales bacterium]|nr:M1 family metallopeptidase [Clostridiales bacterium]